MSDDKKPTPKIHSTAEGRARACAFLLERGYRGTSSDVGTILVEARPHTAHVQAGDLVAALKREGLPVRPYSGKAEDGISIRVFFDPVASTSTIEVFGMSDELFPEPKPAA